MDLKGFSTAEALQKLHDDIEEALIEGEDQTNIKYELNNF